MNIAGKNIKSKIKNITIRCFAELNDFLPAEKRQKSFSLSVKEPVTISEVIQMLGIPLSEVDLVTVNSKPVSRSYKLLDKDIMSVYPTFETFDITGIKTTRQPIRVSKFILDAHLGKLSRYLRMLGFDTLYKNDYGDDEIIAIAEEQNRIILTRDKLLLRSPQVSHGYFIRATEKHEQLIEVVKKFDLYSQFKSFTRCMTCNNPLVSISKETIRNRLDENIVNSFDEFYHCSLCDKIFWKGSHFEHMEQLILEIIKRKY